MSKLEGEIPNLVSGSGTLLGYETVIPEDVNVSQYDDADLIGELPTEEHRRQFAVREAERAVEWLQRSPAGAYDSYHLGNLAIDRETNPSAHLLAMIFLRAADHQLVMLVQDRLAGIHATEYLAYRTAKQIMSFHVKGLNAIISEFEGKTNGEETK